jgi:hypothetical protein
LLEDEVAASLQLINDARSTQQSAPDPNPRKPGSSRS